MPRRGPIGTTWPEWDGWRYAAYYRQRAGLLQTEVAEKAGLSVSWVRQIETGRVPNPQLRALLAFCEAVGVPPEAMM